MRQANRRKPSATIIYSVAAVLFFALAFGMGFLPDDGGAHGKGWMGVAIALTMGVISGVIAFSNHHSNRIYDRRGRSTHPVA